MAPNVYAHVTLLQPHAQTGNDLPIRLYGIAPVKVTNPQTKLKPVVESADVFAPEATSTVRVREASGRPDDLQRSRWWTRVCSASPATRRRTRGTTSTRARRWR
jgi:hypothetical protein